MIPHVYELDTFTHMKETGRAYESAAFEDIHMPSNISVGIFIAVFSLVLGFAGIWHIWWLAIVGLIGILVTVIMHANRNDDGYFIPAETVRMIEESRGRVSIAQETK